MNGLKGWCAVLDVRPHGESPDSVRVLRLTLPQELPGERREQAKQKPVGKAFAMVANRSSNGHSLASECVKSNEGDEEIIKVYLKARGEGSTNHEEKVTQLKSEVRYIQEVVLEQHNGSWKGPERLRGDSWEEQEEENCSSQDVGTLQETARRLLRRLQEAEKRHQLERKAFERKVAQYQEEAERASSALRRAERDVEQKEGQVDELQRLLTGMEKVPGAFRGVGLVEPGLGTSPGIRPGNQPRNQTREPAQESTQGTRPGYQTQESDPGISPGNQTQGTRSGNQPREPDLGISPRNHPRKPSQGISPGNQPRNHPRQPAQEPSQGTIPGTSPGTRLSPQGSTSQPGLTRYPAAGIPLLGWEGAFPRSRRAGWSVQALPGLLEAAAPSRQFCSWGIPTTSSITLLFLELMTRFKS
ncbi:tuftelin isoform X1 [Manacus candei]|uniref:tuftelin isoform X1 n=1 Tax=Manacus candei TaxID=415023 RepID=UPI0022261F4B|nr:tuftelin isoform X1 [Manacus candei]